jgi:hypothetical protein
MEGLKRVNSTQRQDLRRPTAKIKDTSFFFMDVDKFITELIGYHEQIKQLRASENQYKELAGKLQETMKK